MSLNSPLAKELKDAGFPQEGNGRLIEFRAPNGPNDPEYLDLLAYEPTLEELIEACGGDYAVVEAVQRGWLMSLTTESLARYWLALNKK